MKPPARSLLKDLCSLNNHLRCYMFDELKKRRKRILEIVSFYEDMGNPLPATLIENAGKIAFISSHLASGSIYDYQLAGECYRRGFIPCWNTFEEDVFFSGNRRKLAYLYISDNFGNITKLTNAGKHNGKKLSEIILDSGQSLVDFHLKKNGKKFLERKSELIWVVG